MRKISEKQYNLYMLLLKTHESELYIEIEWYMNKSKTVWGMIGIDVKYNNYTVILSARDENGDICYTDLKIDIDNIENARFFLFYQSAELEKQKLKIIPFRIKYLQNIK